MTIRTDLTVDWSTSPRLITVGSPSVEVTIQDLVDTLRDLEDNLDFGMQYDHIMNAAGKEDLGGGVTVGITATLQNAYVAFEARTTPQVDGAATSTGTTILTDTTGSFITNGIGPGAMLVNFTDSSITTVVSVSSETVLTHFPLTGGVANDWSISDDYTLTNETQCEVSGGNLVAINSVGSSMSAIFPTVGVQVKTTASSSATLQELSAIQYSSFNGGITIDVVNGIAGTGFPIGTIEQPVSNVADAKIIASTRGFSKFFIIGDITFTTGDDIDNFIVEGASIYKSTVTLDVGASVSGTEFLHATLTGTLDGSNSLYESVISTLSYVEGAIYNCLLDNVTITLAGSNDSHFIDCWSGVIGVSTPVIDMGGSGRSLGIRGYAGGLEIRNKTGAGDNVSIDLNSGNVILDSTVTAGTIIIRGVGTVTDNSVGATVITTGLINPESIADIVWDEQISEHTGSGSTGEALDNVSAGASPAVIADAVWDETLTGATHNVANSAGRRLRASQEYLGYEGGFVWIDTVNGTAGTDLFESGTVNFPVDNMDDAIVLAGSANLVSYHFAPESALTLTGSSIINSTLRGDHWYLTGSDVDIGGTNIYGGDVDGVFTASDEWQLFHCHIEPAGITIPSNGHMHDCNLKGNITIASAGDFQFYNCSSSIAGGGTPTFDFNGFGPTTLSNRRYSGGMEFLNMDAGDVISFEGNGQIILNANCIGGEIHIRGNFKLTDNSGGAVLIVDEARYAQDQIAEAVWDTAIGSHETTGTYGEKVGKKLLTLAKFLGLK